MFLVLIIIPAILELGLVAPENLPPIEKVVRGFGYDLETHTVVTSDGYKLTVHRLLPGPAGPASDIDRGVPVLLTEGITQDSTIRLCVRDDIAYALADHGFDVWLFNYRGNPYSQQHVTLSPHDADFWKYSLDEMGLKDLPAVIDFMLKTTHRNKIIYEGFSMGTTMFWIMASELPEYKNKVAAMVALAPMARLAHTACLKTSAGRYIILGVLHTILAANVFDLKHLEFTTEWICSKPMLRTTCEVFRKIFTYFKTDKDSPSVFLPFSTMVLIHYLQITNANKVQKYDYGYWGNMKMYKSSTTPPQYDLKKIDVPIYFIYSDHDDVCNPEDVEWLAEQLPKKPPRVIMSVKNFNHEDYLGPNPNLKNLLTLPLLKLTMQLANEHKDDLARVTSSE